MSASSGLPIADSQLLDLWLNLECLVHVTNGETVIPRGGSYRVNDNTKVLVNMPSKFSSLRQARRYLDLIRRCSLYSLLVPPSLLRHLDFGGCVDGPDYNVLLRNGRPASFTNNLSTTMVLESYLKISELVSPVLELSDEFIGRGPTISCNNMLLQEIISPLFRVADRYESPLIKDVANDLRQRFADSEEFDWNIGAYTQGYLKLMSSRA